MVESIPVQPIENKVIFILSRGWIKLNSCSKGNFTNKFWDFFFENVICECFLNFLNFFRKIVYNLYIISLDAQWEESIKKKFIKDTEDTLKSCLSSLVVFFMFCLKPKESEGKRKNLKKKLIALFGYKRKRRKKQQIVKL